MTDFEDRDAAPPRTEMSEREERELWERFIATRAQNLRDRLIEHYAYLVYETAGRLARKLPDFVAVDDLIGWGNLGLLDAIERYDPGCETKFSTYCCTRLSGQIFDELRRLDWTPRLVRQRAAQFERAHDDLCAKLGREPNDTEMAKKLKLSMKKYAEQLAEIRPRMVVSLNRPSDDSVTNEVGKIELLADHNAVDPLAEIQRQEVFELAMRGLNDDQKKVMLMYYVDDLRMKEIGELLGLSESRVCQIHKQTLGFLQDKYAECRNQFAAALQ
jgi:RNA polymerase sigma factor for flagellar operon FliA